MEEGDGLVKCWETAVRSQVIYGPEIESVVCLVVHYYHSPIEEAPCRRDETRPVFIRFRSQSRLHFPP